MASYFDEANAGTVETDVRNYNKVQLECTNLFAALRAFELQPIHLTVESANGAQPDIASRADDLKSRIQAYNHQLKARIAQYEKRAQIVDPRLIGISSNLDRLLTQINEIFLQYQECPMQSPLASSDADQFPHARERIQSVIQQWRIPDQELPPADPLRQDPRYRTILFSGPYGAEVERVGALVPQMWSAFYNTAFTVVVKPEQGVAFDRVVRNALSCAQAQAVQQSVNIIDQTLSFVLIPEVDQHLPLRSPMGKRVADMLSIENLVNLYPLVRVIFMSNDPFRISEDVSREIRLRIFVPWASEARRNAVIRTYFAEKKIQVIEDAVNRLIALSGPNNAGFCLLTSMLAYRRAQHPAIKFSPEVILGRIWDMGINSPSRQQGLAEFGFNPALLKLLLDLVANEVLGDAYRAQVMDVEGIYDEKLSTNEERARANLNTQSVQAERDNRLRQVEQNRQLGKYTDVGELSYAFAVEQVEQWYVQSINLISNAKRAKDFLQRGVKPIEFSVDPNDQPILTPKQVELGLRIFCDLIDFRQFSDKTSGNYQECFWAVTRPREPMPRFNRKNLECDKVDLEVFPMQEGPAQQSHLFKYGFAPQK